VSDDVLSLIKKMGEKETALTELEFVSPIFNNRVVATRVDGVLYTFQVPRSKPGWFKIKPNDTKYARIVGEADLMEIEQYLKYFDRLRLVVAMKKDRVYLAVPDKMNKFGLPPQELIPVFLTDDSVMDFDRILARYDGANFWFERVDTANDPIKSEYLRNNLERLLDTKSLKCPGLTFEERLAYTLRTTLDKSLVEDRKKKTFQEDVEHAGGKLLRFSEKSDHYSVTYTVDGEQFTSHIAKDSEHRVIAAGICLAGNDRRFDLKSLITVVREAKRRRIVHRFNIEDPNFRDPYGGRPVQNDDDDYED
jgi:hypothetical protein